MGIPYEMEQRIKALRPRARLNTPKTIRIGTAEVIYTPEGCYSTFQDGSSYGALPHATPDYDEIARRCGYWGDYRLPPSPSIAARARLRFCREHEVFHHLLAEHFHDAPCPILWALAHGEPVDLAQAPYIEAMVQTAQAWVRGGVRPIIGDVRWDALKRRALEVLDA